MRDVSRLSKILDSFTEEQARVFLERYLRETGQNNLTVEELQVRHQRTNSEIESRIANTDNVVYINPGAATQVSNVIYSTGNYESRLSGNRGLVSILTNLLVRTAILY